MFYLFATLSSGPMYLTYVFNSGCLDLCLYDACPQNNHLIDKFIQIITHKTCNTVLILVSDIRFSVSGFACGTEKVFFSFDWYHTKFFLFCVPFFLKQVTFSFCYFPPPIGQKQMHCHENWSLSSEEFEIWDRLYRIKESDGIKEPVLPQVQFETLENLEEIPVSLTEMWKVTWSLKDTLSNRINPEAEGGLY